VKINNRLSVSSLADNICHTVLMSTTWKQNAHLSHLYPILYISHIQ